ncbi:MAG: hypothetical protein LH650_06880 [Chloroflexi bacterium]|nr:hypothetical protein [Chloroflexota bacterium]
MNLAATLTEPTNETRVFAAWSVVLPRPFREDRGNAEDYWHAYDEHRSVSLTSVLVIEDGHPVSAAAIFDLLGPLEGTPVDQTPGLLGTAAIAVAEQPARASRVLSGLIATEGRVLVASITSDDLDWALRVWLSIRSHPVDDRYVHGRGRRRRVH